MFGSHRRQLNLCQQVNMLCNASIEQTNLWQRQCWTIAPPWASPCPVSMVSGAAQELDVQLWKFTLKAALLELPLETAGADILEILVYFLFNAKITSEKPGSRRAL